MGNINSRKEEVFGKNPLSCIPSGFMFDNYD
jgi:hypothetical protein